MPCAEARGRNADSDSDRKAPLGNRDHLARVAWHVEPTLPPTQPGPAPGEDRSGDGGCGVAVLCIILAITIIGLIVFKLVAGRWPWETGTSDPPPGSSSAALSSFLGSDDALIMAVGFYKAHTSLYDAVSLGLYNLKRVGLLYPDELNLSESTFKQFTAVPAQDPAHPHRSMPDPDIGYLELPISPIEEPGTTPSPYPVRATPAVFLRGMPGIVLPTVGSVGAELWLSHREPPGPGGDAINLNADADRGHRHLCWRVSPGFSITANPVPVSILAYTDVD
jgi:hypothetical protein